jgi:hypothetical protein
MLAALFADVLHGIRFGLSLSVGTLMHPPLVNGAGEQRVGPREDC